jgi:LysM repeat protein
MTRLIHRLRPAIVVVIVALAAACSNAPRPHASAGAMPSGSQSEVAAIASLLDAGEAGKAKKRVTAALKRDPSDANLMLLRDSIDRSPQELLGPNHYAYTVQQGDTFPVLAQRFLGNRLKAYQLARYNGISGPGVLMAGQVLQIPGQLARVEAPRHIDRPSDPAKGPPRARIAPAARATALPPAMAHAGMNPVAARQARSAGLAALNEGNPGRAVGLLARAAALDPGNPAIARDLQRAQRINATVKARK